MNEEVFKKLLKKLQGINYFFISGLSVAIHTNGKRIPGDIDIAIHENDVDKFANSVGAKAEKRIIDKGTFQVDDYGFVKDFENQPIEATAGYPKKKNFRKKF